jgi:hypothetical protein
MIDPAQQKIFFSLRLYKAMKNALLQRLHDPAPISTLAFHYRLRKEEVAPEIRAVG